MTTRIAKLMVRVVCYMHPSDELPRFEGSGIHPCPAPSPEVRDRYVDRLISLIAPDHIRYMSFGWDYDI